MPVAVLGYGAAFAAIAAVSLAWWPQFVGAPGLRLISLFAVAAVALVVLAVRIARTGRLALSWADAAALGFLAWAAVSLLWAPDPRGGALVLQTMGLLVALFMLVGHTPLERLRRVVPAALTAAIAGALVLVWLFPDDIGGFGNRNWLAEWLLMSLPFVCVLVGWPGIRPGAYFRAAPWCLAPLVVAAAAVGYLAFFDVGNAQWAVLWLCVVAGCWRLRWPIATGVVLVAPVSLTLLWPGLAPEGLIASLTERAELVVNSAILWWEYPIWGHGLGGFVYEYGRVQEAHLEYFPGLGTVTLLPNLFAGAAHNEYMQGLVELGVVGMALAGLLLWFALRTWSGFATSTYRHWSQENGANHAFGSAARWSLFITAILAVFSFPLQEPASAALAALSLGIVARGRTFQVPVASALAAAVGVFLMVSGGFGLAAEYHHRKAIALLLAEEPGPYPLPGFAESLQALWLYPWHTDARRQIMLSLAAVVSRYRGQVMLEAPAADSVFLVSMSAGPHHPATLIARAEYLLNSGRWVNAAPEVEAILARLKQEHRRKSGVWLLEAAYAARTGQRERAVAAIERGLSMAITPKGEVDQLEYIRDWLKEAS